MTLSAFAKTIRSKHPGAYDDMDDVALTNAVLKKFPQYKDMVDASTNPETADFERAANYPPEGVTTFGPSVQVAMIPGAVNDAAELGASAVEAAPKAASAIGEGLSNIPETLGNVVSKVKSWLPNPSLKGLGYGASQVGTEAGQTLAGAAQDYATQANPDIGNLVAKAAQPAAEDTQGLITRAATDEMKEPIMGSAPSEANSAENTGVFNSPIANGMSNSAAQMRDLANEQWKQVGNAIDNTLQGLNKTGVKYDPEPVLKQVEGMFERDAQGNLMTTGWQGETNQAISDALESMKNYANGDEIDWTAANRIKSGLQDSGNYAAKRFDQANESYKTVASLIKDSIDDQAEKVLSANGGNIEDFQKLRGAYSKLSSLKSVLNPAAGKEMLQPSLGENIVGIAKKAIPFGALAGFGAKAIGGMF